MKDIYLSLKNQLNTFSLNDEEKSIAEFLVGSIDDIGYIRREILDLVDDLAFTANIFTTEEKVLSVLKKVVHNLDPIGVGARDLKECLIIQLKSKEKNKTRALAINILENAFDHFVKKHYKKLLEKFSISEDESISLKDGVKSNLVTRLGLQVKMVDAETGLYMPGSGLGKATTTREMTLINDENLEEIKFNQSSIGTSTKKALETAVAKVVKRMIRKRIFDH